MSYPQNDGYEPINSNIKRVRRIDTADVASGTFTPVLHFGGNSAGIVYTSQIGYYTEVGDVMHIDIDIALSSKGSSTGAATISGLPKKAKVGPNHQLFMLGAEFLTFPASEVPKPRLPSGSDTLQLITTKSGSASQIMMDTDFDNSTSIEISGTYLIERN